MTVVVFSDFQLKEDSILFYIRSDYCTVDGAGIVLYKVTKYRRTKAFKSAVMVGQCQGKRREGLRVSIRVSVVIRQKFHRRVTSPICSLPQSHDALVQ